MNKRYLNQTGFSLIELLIVMAMGTVIMTATISTFVKQERLMRNESTKTNLRALGRIAIADMVKELRRSGFGFSSGEAITAMSATSVTIQGNVEGVVTTIAENITAGADDVDVFDDSNFVDNDNIVITDPTPGGLSETHVINGSPSSDNIDIDATFANSYLMEDGVLISKYQTLNYTYDSANLRITASKDGGPALTLVGKVSDLTFSYFDEDGVVTTVLSDVRRIDIQLTMTDINGNSSVSTVFNTGVNLRNMN